ncbi:TRAP transporter small permease subunit [Ruegeria pomeroyi]|jgi:TRAP-type mannitol/chloroaromatic compound transport system permease small subunit|nr:TRAP transporter small permease subunit [Ruegeria pomeroyi]NVK98855.1 TRAP transporter small permease subunit [Ruegeria pomeroyi]NVK99762.1 TRAP transporter small permease subunit [Ruegeria pomeroyi]QWV09392.1 TRAP transporter small permease subunit [Ruegeria pomeroyi]HCE70612.1 C4-dicarboxylate ABC transporter permease [Ruegeria sp.]
MQDDNGLSFFGALWNGLIWLFQNIAEAFYNFGYAVTHPQLWLDWSDKASIMRFVYYGGSVEFFFVIFTFVLILTAIGMYFRPFMWGMVRLLEGFANTTGRFFAWAGLLMVLQQIIIVFMQRVFARPDLSFGFGIPVTLDVSWWSEELKLYNAMVVCLCATYTFVQGGHVRVDLIYSGLSHRGKRVVDMAGSLLFMMPMAVVTWLYGWYFLWRHLIVPNPSASDQLDRLLMKSRALRWNVETIGFSPNGFNGYFLFKILLVTFAAMVFIHAVAFFYRSWLEFVEGEGSAGKFLDKDSLGEGEEAYEGTH